MIRRAVSCSEGEEARREEVRVDGLFPEGVRDGVGLVDDLEGLVDEVRGGESERDLGRKRVIRRRFHVRIPRTRSRNTTIHASRPFREMIPRRKISRNDWETTERGAV